MWFQKLIVSFFFAVDKVVYGFIPTIYDLLMDISRTTILTQGDINIFYKRVYALLAIFMLFKVGFSLITYVVNPDDFNDKSKGLGKIGQNVVLSLCLLVLVPYAFDIAYDLQQKVLESNVLAKLLLSQEGENTDSKAYLNTAGDEMAFTTLIAFYKPNSALYAECVNLYEDDTNYISSGKKRIQRMNEKCTGVIYDSDKDEYGITSATKDTIASAIDTNEITTTQLINYVAGVEHRNVGLMFRLDISRATVKAEEESEQEMFIMDYSFIFSTIMGVVIVLLLLGFCLDIALRCIKLAFLQIIAPVPIISFIDPKSGKDGMFKKWYKMCFSTYLSLFIRLLALYFAIYIISRISGATDIKTGALIKSPFIKIFIMIGALMFAKQLPKILEGLGIKVDGDGKFNLNPLRKIENEALGGKILKKPNDLLAKGAKAVLLAPASGASLFGKKMIGGIDAARNGKGFKQGFNRTHGKLYNAYHKKLDEWAPDSAEARKNERLGREEVAQMRTKWSKGKSAADRLYDYGKSHGNQTDKPFDLLDGRNEDAYKTVYNNSEFIKSRMELDKADAKNKILKRISEQTMRGVSVANAIKAEKQEIDKLDEASIKKINDLVKDRTGKSGRELEEIEAAEMAGLTKLVDDTAKQVSGMEKVHESIRKQNAADAATEDALKHVKYNSTDPTNNTRTSHDSGGHWNR